MKYINAIFFLTLMLFSCQLLAQKVGTEGVEVINMEALNSEYEDFAPMPYGNKLMYTKAVRKHKPMFGVKLSEGTKMFTDVMSSTKNREGKFPTGKKLSDNANYKFFDGAPTFLDAGKKMIYSRSNLEGKNKKDTIVLKIYEAVVDGDGYKSEKEIESINSEDYSNTHPTASKDGKRLYFTSNRPGGYGGMDLWYCDNVDGTWGAPKNLGAEINTPNNEIFPYIDMQNNLFYSSNKSGNLDIYVAQEVDGMWQFFGSLGTPFNSGADDMNYVANADGTEGYFASARPGGKGFDDIYMWKHEPVLVPATIIVIDEDTKEVLEEATVMVTPTLSGGGVLDKLYRDQDLKIGEQQQFMTNAEGKIDYEVYTENTYDLIASKQGYATKEVSTTELELTEDNVYFVPLKRDKRNMNILVIDAETKLPIVDAKIVITNLTTGETQEVVSGPDGRYKFEIDCSHEFKITAEKEPYSGDMVEMKDLMETCKTGDVDATLELNPLRLVHVYFDFDKSTLRLDESLSDLQQLKNIMNDNPNYTAELRGHTDSRGGRAYNKALSVRRARAVVNWLSDNGIQKDRLVAVGLGETQLVNNCADGIRCSELEHQLNRRTEFKLISKIIQIKEINSSGKTPRVDPCKNCPHEPQP